jgi:hypothetical protein
MYCLLGKFRDFYATLFHIVKISYVKVKRKFSMCIQCIHIIHRYYNNENKIIKLIPIEK